MARDARALRVEVRREDYPLKIPFRISGYVFRTTPCVIVTLERNGHVGRGEAEGVYYLDDTADRAADTIRHLAAQLSPTLTRDELQEILPPCGARNALDCALWDLEAKEAGRPVWELAGLPPPRALLTTQTLGAEDPGVMAQAAAGFAAFHALKLKLTGETDTDIARVRAVRQARPDVWIGVDANQGYSPRTIEPLLGVLVECRVALLEQPFRRGAEADMDEVEFPVPVAADESCVSLSELDAIAPRFDVVNIKLDKCGGLTEGLQIAHRAKSLGMDVMVGNMTGGSLAMAPSFVVGQLCDVVDLDGPTFLADEPAPRVDYTDGHISCGPELWGGGK